MVQTGILGVAAGELQDRVILVDADDRALRSDPSGHLHGHFTGPAPQVEAAHPVGQADLVE